MRANLRYISAETPSRDRSASAGRRAEVVFRQQTWHPSATFGATPRGHTRSSWSAVRPYFTGLSRSRFIMAEREGFSARVQRTSKTAANQRFQTTAAGCVCRQYVPEPASQLKRIRANGKRFPPSCAWRRQMYSDARPKLLGRENLAQAQLLNGGAPGAKVRLQDVWDSKN